MKLFNYKYPALGFILVLFIIILYMKPAWVDSIENSLNDINYTIRGSRSVSDKISVIYLGDDDLKALGEWPITRDYYSYIIHILKSSGAKTIGLDVLFAHPDNRHPEYDKTLSDFLLMAGNVCLPMTFSELKESSDTLLHGINPTFPFENIRKNAVEIGFSNFGKETNNKHIPVKVHYNDSSIFSFGFQLAKNYLGAENFEYKKEKLYLNHFGEKDKLHSVSFLNLLHNFQTNPDSLFFKDKLVLFTITASGVATLKKTPFDESFPASLIHLTVAENLITKNYLTDMSQSSHLVLLILLFVILVFISIKTEQKYFLLFSLISMACYWFISLLFFLLLNTVLPTFIPIITLTTATVYLFLYKKGQQKINDETLKTILQTQIENKELQLDKLREKLQSESLSASDAKKLAEERKQSILKLEKEINDLQIHSLPKPKGTLRHSEIICSEESPMIAVLDLVSKVSSDNIPVLIMGETGTGKELIARIIHQKSHHNNKPFVAINCGALPENLLESELFGHEKGSFTGSVSLRKGRFEIAADGTVFLDEITETSLSFQIKLLRVLQEGTFERLGGEKTLKTTARVIAASNKNIQQEIENNNFRSDLFYRLNGFPVTLPNLRDRLDDIAVLSMHFISKYNYNMEISAEAINVLKEYQWPGNVRELENIIRRAALLAQSENRNLIQEKDLAQEIKDEKINPAKNIYYSLDKQILETLRVYKFSHSAISQTAKTLDNRDRGTITEYFRGMCFEYFVKANFNKNEAARQLAQSDDNEIIEKVEMKISTYLENLRKNITTKETAYKGLPKKYHGYLEQILENISK